MKLNKLWILFLAAVMLLAACTPAASVSSPATPTPEPVQVTPTLAPAENQIQPPAAVSAAQQALAEVLGIPSEEITISSIEEMDFPNTCLGLADKDEACGEAIVRGYKAMLEAGDKSYEARTSLDGKEVRFGGDISKNAAQQNEPAVAAAIRFLAAETNIPAENIKVLSAEAVMWSDSCLGVARPEESCLAAITPGFKVVLEANGQPYQVHTDQDGSSVRMAGLDAPQAIPDDGKAANSTPAVQAAQQLLSQQQGVAADQVNVIEVEEVMWPNGCLGVEAPGTMCTQAIVPGFRIVLEQGGKRFEYHTDQAGGQVLLATPALPETATKVVAWEQTEGTTCTKTEIGVLGVAFGPCDGKLQQAALLPNRVQELAELYVKYGAFQGETRSGSVAFTGQGTAQPSEVEMRGVAEWAKLVVMEAQSGRSGAAWGLAMAWHQEGGIAGMCADLAIYRSGMAQPTSCKAGLQGQLESFQMSAEDMQQLYTWVDTLASFEYEQKDSATADGMLTRLVFTGTGTQKATPAQQQQIAQFAQRMYLESTR